MALEKITRVSGKAVYVPGDDIDTDRIIPARFMKCVTFDGLGEYLFYDVKYDADKAPTDHSLNDPRFAGASIMLSGMNFGCGSSREHAPQSLYRAGFRVIIAGNFAEIFFGNSINLGIPCVSLDQSNREKLASIINKNPELNHEIDLVNREIVSGESRFAFKISEGARESLLNGKWDPLDELLENSDKIERVSLTLGYT